MLGYKPDFQYQYEKIKRISYKDLFNKINDEIQLIINNRDEINSIIPAANRLA